METGLALCCGYGLYIVVSNRLKNPGTITLCPYTTIFYLKKTLYTVYLSLGGGEEGKDK